MAAFLDHRIPPRTAMTDGTGTTSFGYDSLDRLTGHTNARRDSVSYGWDLAGRLASVDYPDGATVACGHEAAGGLKLHDRLVRREATF